MRFYDTSSILKLTVAAFDEPFIISSVSIQELESIKQSKNKSDEIKRSAALISRLLDSKTGYEVVIRRSLHDDILKSAGLPVTNDNLILAAAAERFAVEDIVFVSDDIVMRLIASSIFMIPVERIANSCIVPYSGFSKVCFSEKEMAEFYVDLSKNPCGLLQNEYLLVSDEAGIPVDAYKWDGTQLAQLCRKNIKTMVFGDKIRPKDFYQQMAIDSILTNTLTAIGGRAGSGKSLISLATAMYLVECGKYDRVVILFNPTSARGAARLGYYSGDMVEKAMQTSIGNVLISKFGDRCAVDVLMKNERLKLVSMADTRGFEVRDNEILYITEAQNTSIDLMKLCLSRASQGCKIIIEGDYTSQVDEAIFNGDNNGMMRVINVLKGEDIFGCVELQKVWRSKIAELVDKM